jgi:hypothetical protein
MNGYKRIIAHIQLAHIETRLEIDTSDIRFNTFAEDVRTNQRAGSYEYINLYDEQGENPTKICPMHVAAMWTVEKK